MFPVNTKPVVIAGYDPAWPAIFERLRQPIALATEGLASAIEHVGSTAVPGLAAKPIVDIDILLKADHLLAEANARLGTLGYGHLGELGIPGRHAFTYLPGTYAHNLYVCLASSVEFQRHIAFRDHLRRRPEAAAAYAALKQALAKNFRHNRDAYTDGKSQFIEEQLRLAGFVVRPG